MNRLTFKSTREGEWQYYLILDKLEETSIKLGHLEDIQELIESNSNYALMYVDRKYILVDTTNNAFDILKVFDDNFKEVEL